MSVAIETTNTTARVRRGKAKQEDLPTIEPSDRRIAEIEDLGDELADLQDEMASLKGKVKDADENLVTAMLKREKTYYNRPQWGSVLIKETKTTAKVKKAGSGKPDEDISWGVLIGVLLVVLAAFLAVFGSSH